MRSLIVCALLAATALGALAQRPTTNVKKKFESSHYTVTFGRVPHYDQRAELTIGDGNGHGGTLGWLRFVPVDGAVTVLSIEFDEGWEPYKSKWPPDRVPVTVKSAQMKAAAYAALLHDLAVVASARPVRVASNTAQLTSNDFWVSARLAVPERVLLDTQWAGYWSSVDAAEIARPKAAVDVARSAVSDLKFVEHVLNQEERQWASDKFVNDWKWFKNKDFYWWVRERYIALVGVVGNAAAFPTLRGILAGDPKDRTVYFAINAITRLTGKDVRDMPIEDMDVEKTRRKILELLDH